MVSAHSARNLTQIQFKRHEWSQLIENGSQIDHEKGKRLHLERHRENEGRKPAENKIEKIFCDQRRSGKRKNRIKSSKILILATKFHEKLLFIKKHLESRLHSRLLYCPIGHLLHRSIAPLDIHDKSTAPIVHLPSLHECIFHSGLEEGWVRGKGLVLSETFLF